MEGARWMLNDGSKLEHPDQNTNVEAE